MPARQLVRWVRMPFKRQLLALEALASLTVAMLLVKYVPFRHWSGRLGDGNVQEPVPFDEAPTPEAREVAYMIRRIDRLFANRFTCLMQAVAAKWMLKRRRIPNTLVLGVRTEHDTTGPVVIKAHAWLHCGSTILLGGKVHEPFTPIHHYYSTPGPRRFLSTGGAKHAFKMLLPKRKQR